MSSAFVFGGTGAVGSDLVKLLGETSQFAKVALFGRRNNDKATDSKFIQKVVDFEKIDEISEDVKDFDVGFCALGASYYDPKELFYRVDHDYVMSIAKLAKDNGVKMFVLVSSSGADEKACANYSKVKGQVEREVEELGFDTLVIMRPAAIEAKREKYLFLERVGMAVLRPLIKLNLANNLTSTTYQVASAMVMATRIEEKGTHIWTNARIIEESKNYNITNDN